MKGGFSPGPPGMKTLSSKKRRLPFRKSRKRRMRFGKFTPGTLPSPLMICFGITWLWRRENQKNSIQPDPLAKIWIRAFAFRLGRRKRVEAVSRLLDGGIVFGDEGWREFLPNLYQGRIGYGDEVRAVYNRSSFVLDVRQPQSRTGLTQRVFDAGCCGVPVLTEWTPELEILFDPEHELSSFRTIEEGIRKREELLASVPAGPAKS